jgi:flagellar basal-body rod protein FlgB
MDADTMANDIFALAARQASWLLARQQVVAQNVANANTPGYKAADLKPFEASLETASLQLAATSPAHFSIGDAQELSQPANAPDSDEVYYSGNDVSEEQEMGKTGQIARAYALNTAIVKAFNGMVLQAVKG